MSVMEKRVDAGRRRSRSPRRARPASKPTLCPSSTKPRGVASQPSDANPWYACRRSERFVICSASSSKRLTSSAIWRRSASVASTLLRGFDVGQCLVHRARDGAVAPPRSAPRPAAGGGARRGGGAAGAALATPRQARDEVREIERARARAGQRGDRGDRAVGVRVGVPPRTPAWVRVLVPFRGKVDDDDGLARGDSGDGRDRTMAWRGRRGDGVTPRVIFSGCG